MEEIIIKSPSNEEELKEASRADINIWSFIYRDADDAIDTRTIFTHFPQGYLVAYINGQGAGVLKSFRINLSLDDKIESWRSITDGGRADKHTEDGDTIYVSSLGVVSDFRGRGIAQSLIDHLKEVAIELGVKQIALGCRIPDYHKYSHIPINDYIRMKREDGKLLDRELRFYAKSGMTFIKPLPEYMSGEDSDPDSLNYGVLSVWRNPLVD